MWSGRHVFRSTLLLVVCGCGNAVDGGVAARAVDDAAAGSDARAVAADSDAAGDTSVIPVDGAGGSSAKQAGNHGGTAIGGNASAGDGMANAAAGGSASAAVAARAESGTTLCQDPRDCAGLACTSSEQSVVHACLAPCASDADCKLDERCFERAGLQKSCFQSCEESPVVCNYQFDCADYYRTGQYLCLPRDWVRSWPPTET